MWRRLLLIGLAVSFLLTTLSVQGVLKDKPKRKKGQPCEKNVHCRKHLTCLNNTCVPRRGQDGECECAARRFDYPDKDRDCREGLICWPCKDGGYGEIGKCVPKRKVGESCGYAEHDCVDGAKCVEAHFQYSGEYVCSKGKKGHACSDDHHCRGKLVCVAHVCM